MLKRGRPSEQRELIAARAAMQENDELVLAKIQGVRGNRVTLRDCVWLAATILNTLDDRPDSASAQDAVSCLRRTKWGMQVDPSGCLRPNHFVEKFLQTFAPDWRWENQRDDGAHEKMNERLAQEHADMDRFTNSLRTRHVTPNRPSPWLLAQLLQIKAADITTWPTLRILKLSTGMSERTITKVILRLEPKSGEICVANCRPRYQKKGGLPKRFGPRLVLGVIRMFETDLENAPLDIQEKQAARKWIITLKRSLCHKIRASVSGT